LASRRPEAIYSSDLKRALETAGPIAEAIGMAIQPAPAFREIFLGDWQGLHTAEVAERYPEAWGSWTVEPNWDLVPGGEPADRFEERAGQALDDTIERHPHGDAIIVTHGGVIQLALHRIMGRPSRGLFPFRISNASVTLIEKRDGRLIIAGVNDTSHLEDLAERPVGPG
jgi:broad specificity phosphatase PhoE